jgi:hypothetical protein
MVSPYSFLAVLPLVKQIASLYVPAQRDEICIAMSAGGSASASKNYAIWHVLRRDDPFRDYANDSELRIAIGHKLMNLVADGVTHPSWLRRLTLESLHLPG